MYPIVSPFRTRTIHGALHIVHADNRQPAMQGSVTRAEAAAIFADLRAGDLRNRAARDANLAAGKSWNAIPGVTCNCRKCGGAA